jgi:hypothetical protein|tara:strand:+ start:109 stop:354 length:246 start_codon:yes stop_codon:yes gene_type:complete
MKGWSPFDKKIKEKESFTDREEAYMDRVYAQVQKDMGDTGTTYSAEDIANMTEEERIGNIDGYVKGDFAKQLAEAKKKVKR